MFNIINTFKDTLCKVVINTVPGYSGYCIFHGIETEITLLFWSTSFLNVLSNYPEYPFRSLLLEACLSLLMAFPISDVLSRVEGRISTVRRSLWIRRKVKRSLRLRFNKIEVT